MVIQRSWKILSDAGSTSASSTEANRSPSAGLHSSVSSSSDDSNCSNQTTHSMVTSVASPAPSLAVAISASSINAIKTDATAAAATTTAATAASSANPVEQPLQKFVTTSHMAETMLQRLRQRLGGGSIVAGGGGGGVFGCGATSESAMRSLELLRISVQSAFDKEIDVIVKRFVENYFKSAFKNIKENLGQSAVSDDMLQKMSCALLENAKAQYNAFVRFKPQQATAEHPLRMASSMKRPAVVTTKPQNATNEPIFKKLCVAAAVPAAQQKQQMQVSQAAIAGAAKVQPLALPHSSQQPASASVLFQPAQLQSQPQLQPQQKAPFLASSTVVAASSSGMTTARRQIFWNTAHISAATKFVLDVQANQAFGFGSDGKERLASKHPELIRYLPDGEDRDWLTAQQIIAPQQQTARFLFLIYDEVVRLQQTHDIYRTKAGIDLSVMQTFTVPEFMIQKMKLFFVDLNIKSRGLITNSFSMGVSGNIGLSGLPPNKNSHLRNALLQGAATVAASASSVASNVESTTLPTALSAAVASNVSTTSSDNLITSPEPPPQTAAQNATISPLQAKPKTSTLSSSHATLTALLNLNNSAEKAAAACSSTAANKLARK